MEVVPFKLSSLRVITVLTACAFLTLAVFVLATTFGEQALSWRDLLEPESPARTILLSVRLPRVMLAGLVGGSLAAAGASLQALTRNALADPFVLGVSGGSALGATIAMVMNLSALSLAPGVSGTTVGSLAGAIGATLLVMAVGRLSKGGSNATLLAGVIFNSFALASVLFIKALAAPNELGDVLWWLAGRLGYEQGSTLAGAAVLQALGLGALWAWSGRLNLLMLGDEDAASLGIDVGRTRLGVLLVTSLMVSVAVSLSGLVGFVGLLVPHVVRLAIGSDHRLLIPASAICGAAFLAFADLLARVSFRAFQQELPVGVVTALLGGPLFLALMVRLKRRLTSSD